MRCKGLVRWYQGAIEDVSDGTELVAQRSWPRSETRARRRVSRDMCLLGFAKRPGMQSQVAIFVAS